MVGATVRGSGTSALWCFQAEVQVYTVLHLPVVVVVAVTNKQTNREQRYGELYIYIYTWLIRVVL